MLQYSSSPLFTVAGKHCSVYSPIGASDHALSKDLVVVGVETSTKDPAAALLNIGVLSRQVMDATATLARVTITFTAIHMTLLPPELEFVVHAKETTELVSWETGVRAPEELGFRGSGTHTLVRLGAGMVYLPSEVRTPDLVPGSPITMLIHLDVF